MIVLCVIEINSFTCLPSSLDSKIESNEQNRIKKTADWY